ncbi:MAG TPA: FAD-binding oxidoreductase [Jatrophihabitantaceae bacterium]|jgi:NAD(P)H-flavin reductase
MDSAALQDSWKQVAKSGDEVPLFFYSHLFLSHPEVREMFPVSMAAQRDKLVGALGAVVSNAHQIDDVLPVLQQLGRDHRRFGAVADHYPAVGASLLATLSYFLGPLWTEELAADWAAAYGLVARVMVQAAEEAEEESPAWWPAEVLAVERRTLDVAVLQIQPGQSFEYQPGQSFAMEVPHRPRLWRYFSPANAPRDDGSIELHVQLVAGGQVSTSIARSTRIGDTVRIGAPVGDGLTREAVDGRDLLMVAGGTGLAPLRAVLEQIDRDWQTTAQAPQVHLFHGARMPWNLYEHNRLSRLANRPWFNYTAVVSDDSSYPGTRGLVGSVAAQSPERSGRVAMVCGSGAMVEQSVSELERAGTQREDIRFENFAVASGGNRTAEPERGDD